MLFSDKNTHSRQAISVFLTTTLLTGCASSLQRDVEAEAHAMRQGPRSAPQQNFTSMADSLRCMDKLFIENGVRDLVVLTEDLRDNTKKLNVGARDMLTSAVSDMTRRSRAIRLITFGGDVSNLVNWLNASGANSRVYTFKPDFDIRGSISQMDDNMVQQRKSSGLSLGPFDLDSSKDSGAAVLGLDLSIISTQTMELLPGVVSRNSILVSKDNSSTGGSLRGSISKQAFGVNYDFSFNRTEGSAQAVRTLIELASIELFGKLTRTPYWSCLGIDPEHKMVKDEISDWYHALEQEGKLLPYTQNQLRIRGVYAGPVDGTMNPDFKAVIPKARKALGLPELGTVDEAFLAGLLNLRSKAINAPRTPVAHLTLAQLNARNSKIKKRGIDAGTEAEVMPQPVNVTPLLGQAGNMQVSVSAQENTFVYCYLNDDSNKLSRIYPNRFSKDSWLGQGKTLAIPGEMKFQIKASKNKKDALHCFNTRTDVANALPPEAMGADFEPLKNYSLKTLRQNFSNVTGGLYAEAIASLGK